MRVKISRAFRRGLAADYGTIELFTMPPPGAAP